jgi:hypothetical protein
VTLFVQFVRSLYWSYRVVLKIVTDVFCLEDGGSIFSRNADHPPNYMSPHPRRPQSLPASFFDRNLHCDSSHFHGLFFLIRFKCYSPVYVNVLQVVPLSKIWYAFLVSFLFTTFIHAIRLFKSTKRRLQIVIYCL